ncbi:MAG: hypothetical protein HY717_00315 [Planctomycetes bacterium]|nr:hypothetical protein [Planctomycetota bacterium]
MSLRSRSQPSPWLTFFLGGVLLIPPLAHVGWREWRRRRLDPEAHLAKRVEDLERELASAQKQLALRERELEVLSEWKRQKPEFAPRAARVLPLADPSPRRHALWISCGEDGRIHRETPVVQGGALVGQVDWAVPGRPFVRVQTISDPYFRIRFRYRDAWGFLSGTGESKGGDRPLLEIQFLGAEVHFQEGDKVFTDGKDGIYPDGLLIGELVAAQPGKNPSGKGDFRIRAAISPADLKEVILLVDRVTAEARVSILDGKP